MRRGFELLIKFGLTATGMVAFLALSTTKVDAENVIQPEYADNSLIVEYQANLLPYLLSNIYNFGIASQATTFKDNTFVEVKINPGQDLTEIMNNLAQTFGVKSVERNQIRHITTLPDDPKITQQWHLGESEDGGISAASAWDTQTGSPEIVVAVIDTGVDTDHPDLADNMWVNSGEIADNDVDDDDNGYIDDVNGYDFVDDNGDPNPGPDGLNNDNYAGIDTGVTHGTHVAGIIAGRGNNAVGGSGVAWTVSVMAIQVLDDEGAGTDQDIANGIAYAVDNGANIIHMSLGGYGSTNVLSAGVNYALDRGVSVVAAAGNDGVSIELNPFYPACYTDVIGVGSTGETNEASSFSNFGEDCVDVSAPGESIYSTLYTNDSTHNFTTDYGKMSGTSMAAPVVSGIFALLLSTDPTLTIAQLHDILVATTDDVSLSASYGTGRVNASAALAGMSIAQNPPAPTIAAYDNSDQQITYENNARSADQTPYFSWDEPQDSDGIAGYYVYFGTVKNTNPQSAGEFQTGTAFSPDLDSADFFGNESTYYLYVSSVDNENNVSTTPASFIYILDTVIKTPKQVILTDAKQGIKIKWNKVPNEHVVNYKILRKEINLQKDNNFVLKATVKSTKNVYVDKKVDPGISYQYKVKAIDDLQNNSYSQVKKIKFIPPENIVMVPGQGGTALVRIYNPLAHQFTAIWQAYAKEDANGINVAAGNLNQDGRAEVVTAPVQGMPLVKVFNNAGVLLSSFYAYESNFTKGVRLTIGDFNGDNKKEIATLPGPGRPGELKIFSLKGKLQKSFLAFSATAGGFLTAADINRDGADELLVSTPTVNNFVTAYRQNGKAIAGFSGNGAVSPGVVLGSWEYNQKDQDNIITIPFLGSALVHRLQYKKGAFQEIGASFYGFISSYQGGAVVAGCHLKNKQDDYFVLGSQGNRQASVNIYSPTGKTLQETVFPFGGTEVPVNIACGWF